MFLLSVLVHACVYFQDDKQDTMHFDEIWEEGEEEEEEEEEEDTNIARAPAQPRSRRSSPRGARVRAHTRVRAPHEEGPRHSAMIQVLFNFVE